MNKIGIILAAALLLTTISAFKTFASKPATHPEWITHPGRTDRYGCHTCRTNCAYWGLEYGEYHCH